MVEAQDVTKIGKRPLIITIICIFNFLGIAMSFLSLIIPSDRLELVRKAGVVMVLISFAICVFSFLGMMGYWKMRKWGVYFYSTMAVINFGSDFLFKLRLSLTGIIHYVLIILVVAIGFLYFERMT